jgi:hypothetical protein
MEITKNKSLTVGELEDKFKGDKQFAGVYLLYQAIPELQANKFYIFNMIKRNKKKGHYVALMTDRSPKAPKAYYYDPFGLNPPSKILSKMINFAGEDVFYNNRLQQDIYSKRCGMYVVIVIDLWKKTKSFRKTMKILDEICEERS